MTTKETDYEEGETPQERSSRWRAELEDEYYDWRERLSEHLPRVRKAIERYRECGSVHLFRGTGLLDVAFQIAEEGWFSWEESSALVEIRLRFEDEADYWTPEFDSAPDDSASKWDEEDRLLPTNRELLARRKKKYQRAGGPNAKCCNGRPRLIAKRERRLFARRHLAY